MMSYALMGVEVAPIILFVFCYLMIHGCEICYRYKYGRKMKFSALLSFACRCSSQLNLIGKEIDCHGSREWLQERTDELRRG